MTLIEQWLGTSGTRACVLTIIQCADHHDFTERELVVMGVCVAILEAEELATAGVTRERHAGVDGTAVLGAHCGLLSYSVRRANVHREVSEFQFICSQEYTVTDSGACFTCLGVYVCNACLPVLEPILPSTRLSAFLISPVSNLIGTREQSDG
jgi:hypothetical protein